MAAESKTPWTPGPWTVVITGRRGGFSILVPEHIPHESAAADVDHVDGATVSHANRRLIAASPELAYLLQSIMDDLPVNRDWLNPDIETAARALLQQIRGEA